jgi:hypothetical protein
MTTDGWNKQTMKMPTTAFVIGFVFAITFAGDCLGENANRTFIEVWTQGDDGLTQRLSVAVNSAFEHSRHFALSTSQKPGTIYVIIVVDEFAGWKKVGSRKRITVRTEITQSPPNAHPTLDIHGATVADLRCWENDLRACADTVERLAGAERAALTNSN